MKNENFPNWEVKSAMCVVYILSLPCRGAELSRLYALGSDVELTLTLVVMSHHQVVC